MDVVHLATSVHCVGRYLMEQGAPPCEILREIVLPPDLLFDSRAWIPRDEVFVLGHLLEERLGDPLAVLHCLERFSLSEYGNWYVQLAGKADLYQMLRHLCLIVVRLETGTRLSLHIHGKECRLRAVMIGEFKQSPNSQIEGLLFNLSRALQMAGDEFPIRVCLPHSAHDVTALEQIYGHPVSFSCDHAELAFPSEALELPISKRQEDSLVTAQGTEFTCREVYRVIQSTLDFDCPTARQVSGELSINLRSMQRHLAAWGVSFEEMVDTYRQRLALQYLTEQADSVTDIAQRLGYSDAAHFTRAFRRWYGVPPTTYRRESLQRG